MENEIYENILEVIKKLETRYTINDLLYSMESSRQYEAMVLPNGKNGAIKTSIMMQPFLFRGESEEHSRVIPSLYRNLNSNQKLIERLKIIEFKNTLMKIPKIAKGVEENENIDFLALAQHYGFKTNLIDLTGNIMVAAFFATNDGEYPYKIKEEGEGVIRCISTFSYLDKEFHFEGIQPLKRPYFQDAVGYEIYENTDITDKFKTLKFKHNKECNRIIREKFVDSNDKCKLMPNEMILNIANCIKNSKSISKNTIIEYSIENRVGFDEICQLIKQEINIIDTSVYKVTIEDIIKYDKEQEENKVFITGRLMYL